MNTDMNTFARTLLWSVVYDKKKMVNTFVGCFVAYFMITGANTGLFMGYRVPVTQWQMDNAASMIMFAWCVIGAYTTSELFSNLRTKRQRSQFFMLPASNANKFWSRVTLALAQGVVLSSLSLVAADVAQMLLSWIFAGNALSVLAALVRVNGVFAHFVSITGISGLNILSSLTLSAMVVTSYVLGGTVFRKVPVVMTTLCWIGLWVAMGTLAVAAMNLLMADNDTFYFSWSPFGSGKADIIAACIVCSAVAVLNMWLSYHRFKRMGIIPGGRTL